MYYKIIVTVWYNLSNYKLKILRTYKKCHYLRRLLITQQKANISGQLKKAFGKCLVYMSKSLIYEKRIPTNFFVLKL